MNRVVVLARVVVLSRFLNRASGLTPTILERRKVVIVNRKVPNLTVPKPQRDVFSILVVTRHVVLTREAQYSSRTVK